MGLGKKLRALIKPDQRTVRKQAAKERRDQLRQNDGLLGIALKKGRMHSFTPDDLSAFYRDQQTRRDAEEARRREERVLSAEETGAGAVAFGEGREKIELGEECDSSLFVGHAGEKGRREAVVVPQDDGVASDAAVVR